MEGLSVCFAVKARGEVRNACIAGYLQVIGECLSLDRLGLGL